MFFVSQKSLKNRVIFSFVCSGFGANQEPVNVGYVPVGLDNSNKEKIYVSKVVIGTTEYKDVDWANTTVTILCILWHNTI